MQRMTMSPMLLLVALMGCSGQGPTAPTPPPKAAEVTPGPPAPAPPPDPPAPPAPVPAPPAPPAPAPKVDDIEVYEATTDRASWPQGAVLPSTFEVTLNFTTWTMQVGPLHDLTIYGSDRSHPFFKEGTLTVSLSVNGTKGTWVFQNLPGEASGTLRRVR